MSNSSWNFVIFAGSERPTDPVALADFLTSVADLRAAVCLEAGVAPEDISPLGYDHSADGYASVRLSWVRHVGQFGLSMFDSGPDEALDMWREIQPELARGDDWKAEGARLHKERYAADCGRETCVICFPLPDEWL